MEQPKITFIIDSKTYSLRANDAKAIRDIPSADRQQLILLLEAVKQQDALAQAAVQNAVDRVQISTKTPLNGPENGSTLDHKAPKPERLGSGDIDALMARLIMEEKRDKKPGPTTQDLAKWVAGLTVAIILLVLIF
jgi:hypothetical protein